MTSPQLLRLDAAPDLVELVHRRLLDAISDGTLAPGQRITQDDIARQLAVSRQPVLQALRLLKKDGFVHDAPGRGVLVAPLDPAQTVRLYQVRGALDALAARLAAQQRAQLDPRLLADGRKAARGRDVQAMVDADQAFHDAIYAACGNPLVGETARQHWHHLRRVMGAVLQHAPRRDASWDQHEAIARAIAAGQPDEAARLTEHHAAHAAEFLSRELAAVLAPQEAGPPPAPQRRARR